MPKPLKMIFEDIQAGKMTEDDLQKEITDMIVKRWGLDALTGNGGQSDDAEVKRLKAENQKLIREYEEMKKLFQTNSDGDKKAREDLQKKITELENQTMDTQEKARREWETRVNGLQTEIQKRDAKLAAVYNRYKSKELLALVTGAAKEANLKNYEIAADYLITKGYVDLKEVTDANGEVVEYQPATREIQYTDPATKTVVKKVFEGTDGLKEAMKILATTDASMKTLFPVQESVGTTGSGSSFTGLNTSGVAGNVTEMTRDERIKRAQQGNKP